MNKKLDLINILRDCPKGTKLYSTILGDVYFERIDELSQPNYPIRIKTCMGLITGVTKRGLGDFFYDGECTLFPSKDQRDWSKWNLPFKDGDIIFTHVKGDICDNKWLSIFRRIIDNKCETYADFHIEENRLFDDIQSLCVISDIEEQRLATEEEKEHFFDVIREKGYTWNANDKKLEKTHKCTFDIKTLKPFDRVLVRDVNNDYWNVNLFGSYFIGWNSPFVCAGKEGYRQCVPYEGNEHLLGTTNDCDDFYKVWII